MLWKLGHRGEKERKKNLPIEKRINTNQNDAFAQRIELSSFRHSPKKERLNPTILSIILNLVRCSFFFLVFGVLSMHFISSSENSFCESLSLFRVLERLNDGYGDGVVVVFRWIFSLMENVRIMYINLVRLDIFRNGAINGGEHFHTCHRNMLHFEPCTHTHTLQTGTLAFIQLHFMFFFSANFPCILFLVCIIEFACSFFWIIFFRSF